MVRAPWLTIIFTLPIVTQSTRYVLAHLSTTPFSWVSAHRTDDTHVRVEMKRFRQVNHRKARQNFLGDSNTPVLKFSDKSPEAAAIAQEISSLFQSGQAVSVPSIQPVFPSINNVNLTLGGLTNQIRNPPNSGTTPFQLNVNLNIELENGKPNKVRVPQGELMLMYIPQIRSPTGGAAVELSHAHLQHILKETTNPTSMVMLPTGGMLLMSLAPYNDTDSRYVMKEEVPRSNTIPHYDYVKQGSTIGYEYTTKSSYSSGNRVNYDKNKVYRSTTTFTPITTQKTTTTFKYPEAWKDKMPQFPFIPQPGKTPTKRTTKPPYVPWKDGNMPVFPHSYASPPPVKVNLTWPFTSTTTSTTQSTTLSTTTRLVQRIITTKSPLFNNQIDVHKPKIKYQESNDIFHKLKEQKPVKHKENSKAHLASLYERLKNNYRTSDTLQGDLRKRYRQDDTNTLGFENVNVVVPGRFNPKQRPDGVTQCKKDSTTNGTRVCSHHVVNNCQGGFKIGGNCNSQQRLDNTKLPPSEFQMGDEQAGNTNTRFVPFSPQQTNMNMQSPPRATPPPFQQNYQLDESRDNFVRIVTTTTRRPRTTTQTTTTMNPRDAMVHRVMNMDPPQLRDALMDPMMMAMGSMMAMAGAYMAIAIEETAAANALALAGGFGGKKKKK